MRKCWLIAILLLIVGCSKDVDFEPSQDQAQNRILSGIIADEKDEDNESRVYLDNKIRIRWNKGDLISVFDGTTRNKEFAFLGADGSSAGDFEDNSAGTIGTGNAIDRLYGLYPYASSTEYCYGEDESEADYLRYTLPATQTYKPNSIGLNANLMVAATANKSDKTLVFRNVCSYLRLKLYGADQTVSSIVFKGNTDEVLTGDVAITATYGKAPTIKMLGAADEDNKTITLDCSEGVDIGSTSDEATEFWLVVPPVNFPNGFTITVKGEDNMGQEIVVNNNLTFARNTYNTITREVAMTEVSDPSTEIPNNQIWYTSSDGKVVDPYIDQYFGATIKSNTYKDGKGVIEFDGDVVSIGSHAFRYCSSLTSVTIPGSVTAIAIYAFYECTALVDVIIPESVARINDFAFARCSSLKNIIIPYGVKNIGGDAFAQCSSLVNVTIPESVKNIGNYAFYVCSSLAEIIIPDSVTSIGSNAFAHCESLANLTIPASVVSIGTEVIRGCVSLSSVVVEPDNKVYDSRNDCNAIIETASNTLIGGCKNSVIPDGVVEIGDDAFRNCSTLSCINIPASVTNIGDRAFSNCSSLSRIDVKATTPPALGEYAISSSTHGDLIVYVPENSVNLYKRTSGWKDLNIMAEPMPDNEIWYTATEKVTPYKTDVFGAKIVSNTYENGKGVIKFDGAVTSIGNRAFYNCSSLTVITIPNSVTSIGSGAFSSCESLTEITLPNSVTSIEDWAFYCCSSLTEITIPNSVTSIEDWAFYCCSSLTEITLPNSVTSIEEFAFSGCSSLTEITLPNSVTSIGNRAFQSCSSLTTITIPNSVTSIGEYAFYYCSSLTNVSIGNSVTSIGGGAFSGCSSLQKFYGKFAEDNGRCLIIDGVLIAYAEASGTEYSIPNSVTSIGEYAFRDCSSLTSINIPNSVTSIGGQAFMYCRGLTEITIPNSVTSIGSGAFSMCSSLTSITIPNSVTSISDYTFSGCSSLTSITIPNSVTSIGNYAFEGCRSLTSITIPNSVTSIGTVAFYSCSSLQNIFCERETPPTGGSAMFDNIHSSAKIYVPAGSGEAYKTAEYWSDYADIIVEEESEPDDTWKIYYTATAKVEPYRENAFNVSIESNQWDSATGEGVITFNGEVNSIGSYAFYSCRNLKSIQIPENVTTIGTAAFRECFKLKDVYLNSKIESIGNSAFVGCFDFYNSTYGSINFHMNSIADWCQIDLPTEVVSGQETIYLYVNGSLIKDIDIPSSINAIKPYAFKFCYVKKITMHKDVTSIGKEAFYDSPVDAIYCKSTTPPAGCEDMFKETSLSYIYVPEESVNSYKTAQYWSSYSSKITPYNFE